MSTITPTERWRSPEIQGLVLILARKLGWEGPIIAFVGEDGTEAAVESALKFICEQAYAEWARRHPDFK